MRQRKMGREEDRDVMENRDEGKGNRSEGDVGEMNTGEGNSGEGSGGKGNPGRWIDG